MNLIIVESPTKAKTLSRFLGRNYRIEATMGHVRDLPERRLGITINIKKQKSKIKNTNQKSNIYEFIPDYQIIAGKKSRVAELKKLASAASHVVLATDPDREGEAIAYHVAMICSNSKFPPSPRLRRASKIQNSKFKRIVFHEITQSAIKEALQNPKDIDMQLVDAQQARRLLDRFVGYKLSPLLWNKLGKRWLSAGRVQSVAVRLIVEREREITAFKSEEYWLIEVELQKEQVSFLAKLVEIDGKKADLHNKEAAEKIVADLTQSIYTIASVETKEVRRFAQAPFTTSTLQQTAANRFGWSAKRTMRTAQSLYEEGHITYHRTDSTNLASEAIAMVRGYIDTVYGKTYLPDSPKLYKTKSKVAQEAHEAIRPTDVNFKFQISNFKLGREAGILYDLIWKRFLACQMREAVFDATSVTILAKRYPIELSAESPRGYILRASGQKMKFDGWLAVYGENQKLKIKDQKYPFDKLRILSISKDISNIKNEESVENNDGEETKKENQELPLLIQDEKLAFLQIFPGQKFTEPPPRYNEASLIKTLEEKGIGRPSTYAPIISTIQDRKYVEKRERRFYPTDLGIAVVDFLVKYFPDVFDISFTAKMEDELDAVANGKLSWEAVVGEFYDPLIQRLDTAFKVAERVKLNLGETDEKCPTCASPLTIRMSKYGKFLACTNFPTCKFTKNLVEKAGIPCPKCGADIILKRTRSGKQFYGCSNYPTCTFAAWKKEDIK